MALLALSLAVGWFRRRLALVAAAVFGAGVLLIATSAQPGRFPLSVTLALLLLSVPLPREPPLPWSFRLPLLLFGLTLVLDPVARDLLGIANAVRLELRAPRAMEVRIAEDAFAGLVMYDPRSEERRVGKECRL